MTAKWSFGLNAKKYSHGPENKPDICFSYKVWGLLEIARARICGQNGVSSFVCFQLAAIR